MLAFEKAYQSEKTHKQGMFMLWDGNRQIQAYAERHVFTTVYEQDSFVPVARLVSSYADNTEMKVYHYHTDHLGTPNELTDGNGKVVWLADYDAWGNVSKVCDKFKYQEQNVGGIDISADELQPIRFQGQFFDGETGLHYNRFRYYDCDVGMFISRDPIGLMGGMNNFQYAPNPVGWIDPLGLNTIGGVDTSAYGWEMFRPLWNASVGPDRKGRKAQPFVRNKTIMNNLSMSAAAIWGGSIGLGAGKSYNENGNVSQCFSVTVGGSVGGQGGADASFTKSVTNASSSAGIAHSGSVGASAVGSIGAGPTGGMYVDNSGNITTYAGVALGGKVGASADIGYGVSYCFGNESDQKKFAESASEIIKKEKLSQIQSLR